MVWAARPARVACVILTRGLAWPTAPWRPIGRDSRGHQSSRATLGGKCPASPQLTSQTKAIQLHVPTNDCELGAGQPVWWATAGALPAADSCSAAGSVPAARHASGMPALGSTRGDRQDVRPTCISTSQAHIAFSETALSANVTCFHSNQLCAVRALGV
jgi:hypothetical protein